MIYFLLPAYNEEKNIVEVLRNIKENFSDDEYCVVLVNDGSTDKTEEVAKSVMADLQLKILSHEKNLGLGRALKTGFEYILENISSENAQNEGVLITLDADNSHPIDLCKKMIEKARAGTDIVIGSRYCPGAAEIGVGFTRKLLSRMASLIFSIFLRYPKIKDYTSGYRAYRLAFLSKMKKTYSEKFITERGFSAGTEILIKSFTLRPKIEEVPLILRYDLKKGKSKIRILPTIFAYLKLLLKLKIH